jgi:uncharacterized protein YcgL (UPF0745 family)
MDNSLAVRAADEGVPIAAIARILAVPFQDVVDGLKHAIERGQLVELPKADWPPGSRRNARVPLNAQHLTDDDIRFFGKQQFKCSPVEAEFFLTLMRNERVNKNKLHTVIEDRRAARTTRPDSMEATDPKMVDVIICKLRRKLKDVDPAFVITTIWNDGYHLQPDHKRKLYEFLGGLDVKEAPAPAAPAKS